MKHKSISPSIDRTRERFHPNLLAEAKRKLNGTDTFGGDKNEMEQIITTEIQGYP